MRFSRDYKEEPIAIVAAECRLPCGRSVEEFWANICAGKIAIDHAPEARFNRELFYDSEVGKLNKTYTDLAALVDYPDVDRSFVPLPPDAEKNFDVAHLAYVDTVAAACRRAGYDPKAFPVRNTGVFVGHTRPGFVAQEWSRRFTYPETIGYLNETQSFHGVVKDVPAFYRRLQERATQSLAEIPPGFRPLYSSCDLARLLAETFKFDGPGMVFNSACASSMYALTQATLALRAGRIDAAIAGGSSYFHSDTLLLFASSRSMTTNRSCPFDQDADGMVVGEGSVAFILKRLSDALAANDPIMALITGVGVASDGKGKSLWAPRKEGQIEAIRRAYVDGLSASDVDYIEAHATSTALGDATELEALRESLGDALKGRRIPLGSAKGNIGHTLEVAGAAGVLKAALTLSTGLVPPVGGLRVPNPKIPWSEIPFYTPMKLEKLAPSPNGRARRAACNSFGIGGLNAHIALDEYLPDYWRDEAKNRNRTSVSMATSNKEPEAIAIVGMGCIFPDAYSVDAFEKLLESDANVFRKVPNKVWEHDVFRRDYIGRDYSNAPEFLAGVIDKYVYDWKKNKVPPKQVANASPIQFMMLDATNEALAALGELTADQRRRSGVVVGSKFGGDFSNKMNAVLDLPRFERVLADALTEEGVAQNQIGAILTEYSDVLHKRMPALLDETGSFTPSALASRITKTLDLGGGAVAVDSENGSFGAALMCSVDQLLARCNDMMIVIGGQQDLGPSVFDLLYATGTLSTNPQRSPFDAQANGAAPGEGCGVLLIKRLEDAKRDGDKILAVIERMGAASNQSVYDNVKLAAQRAVKSFTRSDVVELPVAGLETDVDYVDAVADLVGTSRDEPQTRLGSTSSRVGYFGAGSGVAECVKGVLELRRNAAFPEKELRETSPFFERRCYRVVPSDASNASAPVARVDVVTGENYVYYIRLRRVR
ncbi:MAG: hypothetical protein IK077_01090 [Thermoguttaceae bacterium]|nr:hypothetical protein [Thermoguttaceae bacterium]